MDAPEKWDFDGPWQAAFVNGLSGKWLRLSLNGRSVASYEVAAWGSEQACIEAAWRYAYEPQDDPAPDLAELVEAAQPFALHATDRAVGSPEWRDKDVVSMFVTIGQLRAIVSALAKIKEPQHG